ncbi:MAG TPA: hypothetical protein VLG47_02235 [Candidatus Saccharimonadales bacterium]|nr:hypothetical protein [Candidatus Saccharimonadales bacterium]
MTTPNKNGFYPGDILLDGATVPLETSDDMPLLCRAREGADCIAADYRPGVLAPEIGGRVLVGAVSAI